MLVSVLMLLLLLPLPRRSLMTLQAGRWWQPPH
jgi:hypothetical protein